MQTPPMTQGGIESTKATAGVTKEARMHRIAVAMIVAIEAFPVRATQATDSP